MLKKNGFQVKPLSRSDIRNLTLTLRKKLGLQDHPYFPVIEFLEKWMPEVLFPEFNFEYVAESEMGSAEGLTIPEENVIRIREDVYMAAMRDEGRARFTIAHEIGHYVMHRHQTPCFARANVSLPAYMDSEWQANTWAGELLMPYYLTKGMTIYEIKEKCKVSESAATYQLSKIA